MRLSRKTYWYVVGAKAKVLHESEKCPNYNCGALLANVRRVAKATAVKMVRGGYRLCKRCKGMK